MYTEFLDIMLLHINTSQYSVNITFICTVKPKRLYEALYYKIHFITVVWNWTHNLSEVCLYEVHYYPWFQALTCGLGKYSSWIKRITIHIFKLKNRENVAKVVLNIEARSQRSLLTMTQISDFFLPKSKAEPVNA